jgi:hypothetical protein
LREAGVECVGSKRDEAIVDEITDHIYHDFGKRAFTNRPSKRKLVTDSHVAPLVDDDDHFLRKQLRLPQREDQQIEEACPKSVSVHVKVALEKAKAVGDKHKRGTLVALPKFAEDKRTRTKNRTKSVMSEAMSSWLESEDAAIWREAREQLFGKDH